MVIGVMKKMNSIIKQMDDRVLLLNLYITQSITFVLAFIGIYFFYWRHGVSLLSFFEVNWPRDIIIGIALAIAVVIFNLILSRYLPEALIDDGGINEKIFGKRPLWHIFVISLVVAISEELLFRVVLQTQMGLWLTSLLFAIIHFRYLKKWMLFGMVLWVSLMIGWLYDYTGSVVGPMICHFLIDFILGCCLRYFSENLKSKHSKE